MEIRVLGPLEVVDATGVVHVPGRRERAILTILAVHLGHLVSADALIDLLWPDRPPADPANSLRTCMSRLRVSLRSTPNGEFVLEGLRHGFRLTGDDLMVDWQQVELLAASARSAVEDDDLASALAQYRSALALWRGDPLSELGDHPLVSAEVVRLQELREQLHEERVETELAMGRHHDVVAKLEAMVTAQPLRERRWGQLMLALYRSGRQAEALRAFQRLRRVLAEGLGVDPGAPLVALEDAIIHQKSELDWQPVVSQRATASSNGGRSAEAASTAVRSGPLIDSPAEESTIPAPMGTFVGRLAERGAVRELLTAHRLVSLTGTGGCGKTRLALATAADVSDDGWGARYVDLEAAHDQRHVSASFAEGLGMTDPHRASADTVVRFAARHLTGWPVLVVVDNCEHLLDAAADLVQRLLKGCATMRVLATSREPLGLTGEAIFRVPPMELPPEPGPPVRRWDLLSSDSVQLFVDRAAWPDVALDDRTVEAIARMCRIVDGIPLAIEIAAGLVNTLPLGEVERRLQLHSGCDDAGRRTTSRHRTLAAAMRWSFDTLDPTERALQVGLSAFAGPFNLAAAQSVAQGEMGGDTALVLARLVRKSLVSPESGPGGVERYRLLTTVKALTIDELATPEGLARARHAHADYFCRLAEEADRDVHGPRAGDRLSQIAGALPELREALRYSVGGNDIETGARLAGALRWFFGRLCIFDEIRDWLIQLLARRHELGERARLRLLTAATSFAFSGGDFTGIWELGQEAIALAGELGDRMELAVALTFQGVTAAYTGKFPEAMAVFAQAESLWHGLDDRFGLGWVLTERAVVLRRVGELDQAEQSLEAAIALLARLGDRHSMIMPILHRGLVAQQAGRLEVAAEHCRDAVALAHEIHDRQYLHLVLCCYARVAIDQQELGAAWEMLTSALLDYSDGENRIALAIGVEGLAILAGNRQARREMATLWGFADQLRTASSLPLTSERRIERDRWVHQARAAEGDRAIDAAWQTGRAMTRDDAVALGLAVTGDPPASSR